MYLKVALDEVMVSPCSWFLSFALPGLEYGLPQSMLVCVHLLTFSCHFREEEIFSAGPQIQELELGFEDCLDDQGNYFLRELALLIDYTRIYLHELLLHCRFSLCRFMFFVVPLG